ncbi:hypothetical protein HDU98_008003 [Podochytrium sp. JEL0797]|nr:hypothetical protein HDU98_008003 [Podochytrium sp. JEL0797]
MLHASGKRSFHSRRVLRVAKNKEFLVPSDVFTEIDKILRSYEIRQQLTVKTPPSAKSPQKSNDANRVKQLEAQVETLKKNKVAAVQLSKRSSSPQKPGQIPRDQFVEGCFICKCQCPRAHDPENCFMLRDLKREGKMDEYESFMKQIKERKRRHSSIGPSDRPKAKRARVEQEEDEPSSEDGKDNRIKFGFPFGKVWARLVD